MFVRERPAAAIDWDAEADLLVVGGGAAGLAAAAAGGAAGVDVTVLEKQERLGGKGRLSTGQVRAAGTRHQAAAGIEDTAERLVQDIFDRRTDDRLERDEAVVRRIAAESGETVDWLADEVGVTFTLHTGDHQKVGNSVYRTHYVATDEGEIQRVGRPVTEKLAATARDQGVEIRTGAPVTQLILDDGTVVGAVVEHDPEPDPRRFVREFVRAERTLVATDGFGANYDMRVSTFPELAGIDHWGSLGNTGEAVRWAEALDLEMEEPHYNLIPSFSDPGEHWVPTEHLEVGSIMVNADGERFMDAAEAPYIEVSKRTLEQPGGVAYVVLDEDIYQAQLDGELTAFQFRGAVEKGVFEPGDAPEDLAHALDIDADGLARTIAAVNAHADGGAEPDHSRSVPVRLDPPFYGARLKPLLIKCKAGIRVDPDCHPVRADGTPVESLYVAGNAAMSLTGGDPNAYVPGTNLMSAFTQGRLVGCAVADDIV